MSPLETTLINHIRHHGPVDVETFMTLALTHPEHGYYMHKDPFGASGDFTTAPEISQMFGELLGAWVADCWMQMGRPETMTLLELGPGRGTLMADALRATKNVSGFHEAAQVHLLEASPVLKKIQAQTLKPYKPQWHATLENVPDQGPLIVLANEFLDALPIRQLQQHEGKWAERVITYSGQFEWGLRDVGPDLLQTVPEVAEKPQNGDILEISPIRHGFMHNLFELLKKTNGVALFIDYGYEKPGYGDTLQAIHRHNYCPVFEHIGQADLTAHVDFSALYDLARGQNIRMFNLIPQGQFLKNLGIEMRAQALKKGADKDQGKNIEKALRRLVNSDEMGLLFKVAGFEHGTRIRPAGL